MDFSFPTFSSSTSQFAIVNAQLNQYTELPRVRVMDVNASVSLISESSDYQIKWLMKPERKNFLGKSLLDPSVLVVCVAPNRPSP